jgi:hypothetical protein
MSCVDSFLDFSRSLLSLAEGCGQCERGAHDGRKPNAFCIMLLAARSYTLRIRNLVCGRSFERLEAESVAGT